MPQHIFYSWHANTPTATGKNLIGRALRDAIAELNADAAIRCDEAVRAHVDRQRCQSSLLEADPAVEKHFLSVVLRTLRFGTERSRQPIACPLISC
jgi:hypothetical protein